VQHLILSKILVMKSLFSFILFSAALSTQAQTYHRMNAANNGQTINLTCPTSDKFADDGSGSSHYSNNIDYTITFCAPTGKLIKFDFGYGSNLTIERIDPTDTLFIYDGNSTSSPLLYEVTGNPGNSDRLPYFDEKSDFIFLSASECITFRFKSNGSNNNDGWDARMSCVDPINCGNNEPATDLFAAAPYICNLQGYCGITSSNFGEDDPFNLNPNGGNCPSGLNFLGTIENNSWIKFIADSTHAVFDFNVPTGGPCINGIQTAIFAFNGSSLTRMSPCALSDGSHSGNFQLTANGLTVGDTYYIMVDGNAGDVCNYTINANTGITTISAGTDVEICAGDTFNLTANGPPGATYTWNALDNSLVNALGQNQTVSPIIPTTYVVEVSSGGICENQFDTINIDICSILPVNLLGFTATCNENYSLIEWQTASEINNDYFVLEKAANDMIFVPITTINGNGNSSIINHYSFQDFSSNYNPTYYRLTQVDFDGNKEEFGVITLNNCEKVSYEIDNVSIVNNNFVINYKTDRAIKSEIIITDIRGRVVSQENKTLYPNEQQTTINNATLISGAIYFVNVVTSQSVYSGKVVVVN